MVSLVVTLVIIDEKIFTLKRIVSINDLEQQMRKSNLLVEDIYWLNKIKYLILKKNKLIWNSKITTINILKNTANTVSCICM